MDATVHCRDRSTPQEGPRWSRREVAEKLARFGQLDSPWTSCCRIARQIGVPQRTLSHWIRRKRALIRNSSWPDEVASFFESPHGLEVLNQLLLAAHLVFVQANDCGIRNLSWFLELSGLGEFIAPSYGAQQAMAEEMESLLIRFGQEEDKRLAAQMSPREITLCEDETFHPQICLVAVEPVSNFILVEQYQPQRDATTWNRCLDEKLAGLPVTVCQVTSDQAKALIAHTEIHLGAHHSPDLFHVQYDTVRATSLALSGQTRAAVQELEKAQQKTVALRAQHDACRQQCPESPLGQVLEQHVQQAEAGEAAARERVAACQARQERAKMARRGLSRDYHPVDLETGRPVTADEVAQRLAGHFDTLDQVAAEAGLSAHAREKLAKARRVLDAMQATIAFFWMMIAVRLGSWQLSEPLQQWLREYLIPGYYLRRAAEKAATAQQRQRLQALSDEILARARSPDGLWGMLSAEVQTELERKAQQCADFFQRSSSCVEGRNGQLSLRHHALHQLTARKLQALTVLHNYFVRREDGTTAAERFYGAAPRDLFAWLLEHASLPARPHAARRAA
jgi:hypothetical protein